MFRVWVADLDSPSYFVVVAAVELGFFNKKALTSNLSINTIEGPELRS
jgi:NitT/TauT family transport system substrate-binding protein